MYSMIMMVAMSSTPQSVDFCWPRFGCGGCYSSCSGWGSCHGCWGSYSYGCCSGYCTGYSYYNTYSSCSGYGIYGGASYMHSAYPIIYGCSGCYGYGMPVYSAPVMETVPKVDTPKETPNTKKSMLTPTNNRAVVDVELPENAKLFADGQLTVLSGSHRSFYTPVLTPGKRYQYELQMEVKNAQGTTETQKEIVVVQAGETSKVRFAAPATVTAPAKISSTFIVHLPETAKLFVDGTERKLSGAQTEFTTPLLPKGQKFQYTFKVSAGNKESTQIVKFRAGEKIDVEFPEFQLNSTLASK